MLPYLFALGANFAFAWATVVFAHFSKAVSALWMNAFKAVIAFIAFTLGFIFWGTHIWPETRTTISFLLSGFLGLNIGDWFLLYAFSSLGASRTLMLYGFQPLMLGVSSYFLFDQTVPSEKFIAIIFLIACLFIFSLENFRKHGHWHFRPLMLGLIGITLDAIGVVLTRYGFESTPAITPLDCNFYRCLGAVVGFGFVSFFKPINLIKTFMQHTPKQKSLLLAASLSGTFLSLFLYLSAIQKGHLATVSAIAITSPLFAGIVESLVQRKPPSLYLAASFLFFVCGFLILVM